MQSPRRRHATQRPRHKSPLAQPVPSIAARITAAIVVVAAVAATCRWVIRWSAVAIAARGPKVGLWNEIILGLEAHAADAQLAALWVAYPGLPDTTLAYLQARLCSRARVRACVRACVCVVAVWWLCGGCVVALWWLCFLKWPDCFTFV